MGYAAENLKGRTVGKFVRMFLIALLALTFSSGLFAQAKGLFYGGYLWDFVVLQGGGLGFDQYRWDGSNLNNIWSDQFPVNPSGSIGLCVFNDQIYCFYTTTASGGTLGYVTVNPVSGLEAGPTTIATNLGNKLGAVAAVCSGSIWVFTPMNDNQVCFRSGDGKNFILHYYYPQHDVGQVLDAVTFYPSGDDLDSMMLAYYDVSNPPVLRAAVLCPTCAGPYLNYTQDFVLPWPPANPYLWKPVTMGNLLLGTSGGGLGAPGAKAPCVQFFGLTGQGQDGSHEGRWEYNVAGGTWSFNDWTISNNENFLEVFPSPETVNTQTGMMQMNHLALCANSGESEIEVGSSDYMVPQNNDPVYGWNGTPTPTSNAAPGSDLQGLWTLVGVVLGPPPFPMNGSANACGTSEDALAWVDYGKDTSTTVSTTSTSSSTISVGVNSTIKAGIGQFSLDLSYAHAWTASHGTSQTVSVSQDFQFGPCSEQQGSQGTHGWAIFNAPTMVTQWYKLYAYDYNPSAGQGTYLNQDVYATALGATVQQTAYFDLADPSQGEYPGLFAGMTVYPNSTDVGGWHLGVPDWDSGGSDWAAVFGDTTDPQMPVLTLGERDEVSYTQTNTTTDSKGNSNSFGVQAGAGISFAGFGAGVTVGYDGKWTTNTENSSTITQDVSCALNVPIPPNTTGYVNSMTVQPFWLQAETANAPWLPTGYNGDLPWCIAWAVTQYGTVGGGTVGVAAAPSSASGTIRHGGDNPKDTYALSGGRMAWRSASGGETQIPLTADAFGASKSASVFLNGHAFSTLASKGKWTRRGDTWTFKTKQGTKGDHFSLGLDFASGTWSFDSSSKTLDEDLNSSDASVRVRLTVQGRYGFGKWLKHDVRSTWSHEEKTSSWPPYGVHEVKGAFDSVAGTGRVALKGHIPKDAGSFGDLDIRLNGASVRVPLLSAPGFLAALGKGGRVNLQSSGLSFDIDFGTGKWEATIDGPLFDADMAPRKGSVRVKVLLGGGPLSDQTFVVQKSTTDLRFAG